ncbi:WD40 repeat-like protein [Morchella conica CCBAS932]|uniref:WD40 repeat-like protein n=1 Tax=Morchella conica CCBAS932 TaxID=1392247 RepID=A0A3N4KR29_9PEZI|nr:WD40 repeat-like protein [Morchella conica CCBAS932]
MSLIRKSIYAAQPSTTRATSTHLSVDPKGERLAYASGKSVFLRSIDDPSISTQNTAHTANVNVARFSPSGYYVASGDTSGMVRVWDCVGEDMNTKGEFGIISGTIKDLAWDGESKRIIAVGDGKERFGHCITYDTGNSVGEILGHSSIINSVSIRQQRPYRAATASDDKTLVFYHGTPFKFNQTLTGNHSNFVQGVAFSPDGEHFVSVGSDRKIFLYDGKTGDLKSEVTYGDAGHKGGIYSVSWSSDSKRFVTASADQTVKLWDVEQSKNSFTWKFGEEGIPSIPDHQVGVVWTPRSDDTIISLSLAGDLNYLNFSAHKPYKVVHGHQKAITALKVTKESKTLFTGSYDGRICKWDTAVGAAAGLDGKGHENNVSGFAETQTGSVVSVGWDDHARQIDVGAGCFVANAPTKGQPKGIAELGPNGSTVVVSENAITAYGKDLEIIATLVPKYTPTCVGASSTYEIAIGGQNNIIQVYSVSGSTITESKKIITRSTPTCLSYSPNGKYLAAGDASGKITLYDTTDQTYSVKTTRWSFHTGRVDSIVWNDDGTHVVTGGLDTNVFVYSVENPAKNLKARNAHMGGVNAVGWEEKDVIVSAGADGAVKRWGVTFAG